MSFSKKMGTIWTDFRVAQYQSGEAFAKMAELFLWLVLLVSGLVFIWDIWFSTCKMLPKDFSHPPKKKRKARKEEEEDVANS